MPHSLVVMAWLSPIDSPVRGSALRGWSGARSPGRTFSSAAIRPLASLARLASSRILRSLSPTASGASDVVSAPPAMPDSILPSAILLATSTAAWMPVSQACWTSYAGVSGESFEPEHRLAGEVEVTAVLEHRAGGELADALTREVVPLHEPVERGGEHLLVGGVGVDRVGARERDAVAADHRDPSHGGRDRGCRRGRLGRSLLGSGPSSRVPSSPGCCPPCRSPQSC